MPTIDSMHTTLGSNQGWLFVHFTEKFTKRKRLPMKYHLKFVHRI